MNDLAMQFWPVLWRTTLTLTLAALLCGLILQPARPRSPLVHRAGGWRRCWSAGRCCG